MVRQESADAAEPKLPYLPVDEIRSPRHVKRGAFLQARSEENLHALGSGPWSLQLARWLATLPGAELERRWGRGSDSLGRQLM